MNKLLSLFALAITFNVNAECSITYKTTYEKTNQVIRSNGWGLKNYDTFCGKLRSRNAGLYIASDGVVLGGQSIGWADITIYDIDSGIVTASYGGSSTQTNPFASQDKADELQMKSINSAIEYINVDKALLELKSMIKSR